MRLSSPGKRVSTSDTSPPKQPTRAQAATVSETHAPSRMTSSNVRNVKGVSSMLLRLAR